MKNLFILLILSLFVTTAANSGISVSQNLSQTDIAYEDSLLFEVKIVWDGNQARYLFENPLAPTIDRLSLGKVSSSVSSVGAGESEQTLKTFQFTLHPNAFGAGYIAPISINYLIWPDSLPGELHTEGMTVQIAEPLPEPAESEAMFWWIVVLVVIGCGVAGYFIYRHKVSVALAQQDQHNPKEQFLIDLESIKKDADGDFKRFQKGIWKILREYMLQTTSLDPEQFDDSKLSEALLDTNIDKSEAGRLAIWYIRARQDRFRPIKVEPGDLIRLESEIRNLFENNNI